MALGAYYSLWMECLLTARQPKSCISPAHRRERMSTSSATISSDGMYGIYDLQGYSQAPGFDWNTVQDSGNVNRIRDLTASAEEGFSKIWARMQDWKRKRYTDMYRVWKGILARNTDGIRENPQFFFTRYGNWPLLDREAGFAKNWKKTVFGIEMTDVRGTGLWWKRGEIRDQDPSPPLPASWYTVIRVHFKTYL